MADIEQLEAMTDSRLVDDVASVELRVCDLDESIRFYRDTVGLEVTDRTGDRAALGTHASPPILTLRSDGVTEPVDPEAAGLFHIAIRVPMRTALGDVLARLSDAGLKIGSADHLVSEALYVDDPDGHGVEIYRDRPVDDWPFPDGTNLVPMPTDGLDLGSLFEAGGGADAIGAPAPPGTDIGHVHLQVSNLDQSADFYETTLGLDQTMQIADSARFYSSNAYHHHVGINTWSSEDQPGTDADHAGLSRVVFATTDQQQLDELHERLDRDDCLVETDGRDTVTTADPDDIELQFAAP